jgi:hypothetical protein
MTRTTLRKPGRLTGAAAGVSPAREALASAPGAAPGPRIPALARAPHPRTAANALLLASVEANRSKVRLEMPPDLTICSSARQECSLSTNPGRPTVCRVSTNSALARHVPRCDLVHVGGRRKDDCSRDCAACRLSAPRPAAVEKPRPGDHRGDTRDRERQPVGDKRPRGGVGRTDRGEDQDAVRARKSASDYQQQDGEERAHSSHRAAGGLGQSADLAATLLMRLASA